MRAELQGLKAGKKNTWLRQHRSEIMEYFERHGRQATLSEFNMRPDTFERFLDRKAVDEHRAIDKLTVADRYVLNHARELVRGLAKRIGVLEDWKQDCTPVIEAVRILASLNTIRGNMAAAKVHEQATALLADPLDVNSLTNDEGKLENRS